MFRQLWAFIWSPVTVSLAALLIGVEGVIPAHDRSLRAIIVAAVFVAVNGFVTFLREHTRTARVNSLGIEIVRKLTDLVSSLAEISANQYHVWKVDLYVAKWEFGFYSTFPWLLRKVLQRSFSVALATTQIFDDTASLAINGILSRTYRESKAQIWVNPNLDLPLSSIIDRVDNSRHDGLISTCGILRAFPVVNSVERECMGVLVVHVEPQFAQLMIGTIAGPTCGNFLHRAAVDLHHLIAPH